MKQTMLEIKKCVQKDIPKNCIHLNIYDNGIIIQAVENTNKYAMQEGKHSFQTTPNKFCLFLLLTTILLDFNTFSAFLGCWIFVQCWFGQQQSKAVVTLLTSPSYIWTVNTTRTWEEWTKWTRMLPLATSQSVHTSGGGLSSHTYWMLLAFRHSVSKTYSLESTAIIRPLGDPKSVEVHRDGKHYKHRFCAVLDHTLTALNSFMKWNKNNRQVACLYCRKEHSVIVFCNIRLCHYMLYY